MTKYIHPKLWREANYFKTEYIEWYKISCDWLLVFGDNYITLGKLLNLWFEPVKEEVPEWIDDIMSTITHIIDNGLMSSSQRTSAMIEQLKKIKDNMPKQEQQKITIDEIDNLIDTMSRLLPSASARSMIIGILRAKWLLEE